MRICGKVQLAFALCTLLLLGACTEFEGLQPPDDQLHYPIGLTVHPSGHYLYVVNTNFDVAYNLDSGGTLTVVDADTLEVVPGSTVRFGTFGGAPVLSGDARHLYIPVRSDNSVVRLEVSEDGSSVSCNGGRDGLACRFEGLSADPFGLAVANFRANLDEGGETDIELLVSTHLQSSNVTVISFRDGDPATAVQLTNDITSGGYGLAVHPTTGQFYVSARFQNVVRVFQPFVGVEGNIAAIFPVGAVSLPNPNGLYDGREILFRSDGRRAYVAARSPDALLVIDTSPSDRENGGGARNQLVGQVDLSANPEGLALVEQPAGEFIYVSEFFGDTISIVDPRNERSVARLPVGNGPSGMAVDQTRHQRLYVALFNEAAVAVVDIDPTSPRYRTTVAKIR